MISLLTILFLCQNPYTTEKIEIKEKEVLLTITDMKVPENWNFHDSVAVFLKEIKTKKCLVSGDGFEKDVYYVGSFRFSPLDHDKPQGVVQDLTPVLKRLETKKLLKRNMYITLIPVAGQADHCPATEKIETKSIKLFRESE